MAEATLQIASRLSSPALRGFESSPFRVLGLAPDASTSDASFQAERVLTLLRAGLPAGGEDALAWLAPASVYEVQQAAQTVEEPLARLTEQLLWFDFARDPEAEALRSLLRGLADEPLQKYFDAEAGLPVPEQCDPEDGGAVAAVAQAINQANMRLLVAASLVNGVRIAKSAAPAEPRKIARIDWQTLHGLSALPDAHNVVVGSLAGPDAALDASLYWERALRRWTRILPHPWFGLYLRRCIADLDDDFVSEDDAETVEEGVRARLADLAAQETKFLLQGGNFALAGGMISALAKSRLEKRVLVPALRPIHHLFRSEVAELQALLGGAGEDALGRIDAYLKRLAAVKRRWAKMDEGGLVGLSHILDDALERAYLRLRELGRPDGKADALLSQVARLASAASLRERVNFHQRELEEARKHLCHFCHTGAPDYEKSVVLEGKKQTGVTHSGNTTTTHYLIRYGIVLRCERCARFHQFVRKVGLLATACLYPIIVAFAVVPAVALAWFLVAVIPWGITIYLVIIGGMIYLKVAFMVIPGWFAGAVSAELSGKLLPDGHTPYGDYAGTEAEGSLRSESFEITPDWRIDAVSLIKSE